MPIPVADITPTDGPFTFGSRRSVVHSTEGMVACTQPLAAQCGVEVLKMGGNAVDAAVAVAAALNVTEPSSTGIGGDMFLLSYSAFTRSVYALNGSGRSPLAATLPNVRRNLGLPEAGPVDGKTIPMTSVQAVTVPGAAKGWVDAVKELGSGQLTMGEILGPAIRLAEEGFPVSEVTARYWNKAEPELRKASLNFREVLKDDPIALDCVRAPKAGEIFRNPTLAQTFRAIAAHGAAGFYRGRIAQQIVLITSSLGGLLTLEDLEDHLSRPADMPPPIKLTFDGQGLGESGALDVWEHPPNGQGVVALLALGILREAEKMGKVPRWTKEEHNGVGYLHAVIEALRLAFADGTWWVADPEAAEVPIDGLLEAEYLQERAQLFDPGRALGEEKLAHGKPQGKATVSPALRSADTVYFSVTDGDGNAASFINSNYGGFGTGIVPTGCGFTLQNRGANFSLEEGHPNMVAGRKRPYHTIIPGLVTEAVRDGGVGGFGGRLHSVFGVMGGFMQPQGHVQVFLGQVVAGLSPQAALDAPRVSIDAGVKKDGRVEWEVKVEEGIREEVVKGLKELGHKVRVVRGFEREVFGRGQIVRWGWDEAERAGVWSGGSDPRGDGGVFPVV